MQVGMCFDRSLPAPFVVEVAEALEAGDVDQLWVIEDCFYTAGVSLAATALARTERLTVGLGILPAVEPYIRIAIWRYRSGSFPAEP